MFNHAFFREDNGYYGVYGRSYDEPVYVKSGYDIDEKKVIELRKKYARAKLQKNKTEMSNIERQLKYYGD